MEIINRIICPVCQTEINATDVVIKCPSCGVIYHDKCWRQNRGCSTPGCPMQYHEDRYINHMNVCVNCGAPLAWNQQFCPMCGTPKGGVRKIVCARCGTELTEGQAYCPKCGAKSNFRHDSIVDIESSQIHSKSKKAKKKNRKTGLLVSLISALLIAVAVLAIVYVQKSSVSIDELLAQGNLFKGI